MRITDAELAQWLYDAEFDWNAEDALEREVPENGFPRYYEDSYQPTLAALFRELIARRSGKAVL